MYVVLGQQEWNMAGTCGILDLVTPSLFNFIFFIKPCDVSVKHNVHATSKVFLVILASWVHNVLAFRVKHAVFSFWKPPDWCRNTDNIQKNCNLFSYLIFYNRSLARVIISSPNLIQEKDKNKSAFSWRCQGLQISIQLPNGSFSFLWKCLCPRLLGESLWYSGSLYCGIDLE